MNPRTKSQDIRDLSQNDIRELVAELGQPAFRAKQLIEWVFEKNVCSFDDMTNLPKAFLLYTSVGSNRLTELVLGVGRLFVLDGVAVVVLLLGRGILRRRARHFLGTTFLLPKIGIERNIVGKLVLALEAVSYTHPDVYKRQCVDSGS